MSRTPRLEPDITWLLGASVMSASTSTTLHMVTFCTGPPLFDVEHTRAPFIPEWLQVPWGLGCVPLHPPAVGPPPRKPWPQDRGQTPSSGHLLTRHPGKQPQGFSGSVSPSQAQQGQHPAMQTRVPTSPTSVPPSHLLTRQGQCPVCAGHAM